MCGISGFLSHDPQRPGDEPAVRRINDAIRHRGPDADGIMADGPCVLGHRRLSIIDLSPEGRQPLPNEDGTINVVVNGEIYNFAEIREELVAKGHTFRSRSDSEVVVHLYEEVGEACVQRLHGMFALALWDGRKQRLLLACDRAGKKPLFYRRLRHGVAFASEVHALATAFPEERAEADLAVIEEYLTLAELGRRLGYCTRTLQRWHLPSHRHGGKPRYRLSEVEAYLHSEAFQRRRAALRAERRDAPSVLHPPFGDGHPRAGLFASLTLPGTSNAIASSHG